ncbi:MAG: hypothetical protein PHO02_01115 [Candidatus Nanoarchaeia archaeon]|nr:hypothetical protein [Candidatus Nanoarchaeia archaeon]
MKKSLIFVIAVIALLAAPFALAETYSGIERFSDNTKLVFSGGDSKVNLALEIREKEINSAIENMDNDNEAKALKNIENAGKKLEIVQEKVSLATVENIKSSSEEIMDKIEESDSEIFDEYLLEEEKTMLTAVLTEKTYEYCKELAKGDFALMLKEEICNPETAMPGLEKELADLKDVQIKLFVKLMLEIRSCIDDPGTCNCEANTVPEQKAKCEKMVALAMKCEYKADESSCSELKAMEPRQGDSFAESFVPSFLMNLFREKSYMIEYDIQPSDGVPEECWDENTKPECRQYDHLKETAADWDEYGHYIGRRPENREPTMQESIPQCFDETGTFLEEKCGKISVVRNEEGLVNYLIEKEIDNIIDEFENASMQNTIDEGEWTVDEGTMEISPGQNTVVEMKDNINEIKEQIALRTFAPGTTEIGEGIRDIKNIVVETGPASGDGGLRTEIRTDVAGGSGGDNGLTREVKTDVAEGTIMDEPLPEPDLTQTHYDPSQDEVITNNIDNPAVNEIADSGSEGTNDVAPAVDSNEGDDVAPAADEVAP